MPSPGCAGPRAHHERVGGADALARVEGEHFLQQRDGGLVHQVVIAPWRGKGGCGEWGRTRRERQGIRGMGLHACARSQESAGAARGGAARRGAAQRGPPAQEARVAVGPQVGAVDVLVAGGRGKGRGGEEGRGEKCSRERQQGGCWQRVRRPPAGPQAPSAQPRRWRRAPSQGPVLNAGPRLVGGQPHELQDAPQRVGLVLACGAGMGAMQRVWSLRPRTAWQKAGCCAQGRSRSLPPLRPPPRRPIHWPQHAPLAPTWEQRLAGQQLREDAAHRPHVDLGVVVLSAQQQLGRPVEGGGMGCRRAAAGRRQPTQPGRRLPPPNSSARQAVPAALRPPPPRPSPVPQRDDAVGHLLAALVKVGARQAKVRKLQHAGGGAGAGGLSRRAGVCGQRARGSAPRSSPCCGAAPAACSSWAAAAGSRSRHGPRRRRPTRRA
jgi:hypothetical protein